MSKPFVSHATVRTAGFGLIELMIAMVLGLLVLGAAFAVFQSNQSTYRANEGLSRVQESARVAFELMSRDIRAAGGSACSNLAMPDAEKMANLSSQESAFLNSPVGSTASELTVVSGDDTAYRIDSSETNSITLAPGQIADANDAFRTGDALVLCNANKLYVVSATGVTPNTVTFSPATPIKMTADNLIRKPGSSDPSPATVMLARYRSTRWYLDGTTLRVSRQGGAGEAVAEGVQSLAVSYLQNRAWPGCAAGSAYTATPTDWNCVTAVRLNMSLVGQFSDQDGGNKTITRNTSNVVSLRSRTL
ncbi:MAG: hypothetical protein EOP93_02680 [Lysobacteraceae bacterium]|nr:MAG: hypothetical protein EOP93_02680 [Xanthomonadaceae bacterium]